MVSQNVAASVIVPVRDGGADLRELVACLGTQTVARDQFEVLIADDGSTDGGPVELETDDGWIRVFPGPPLNAYAARNRAASAARAPALAFCDADCRPERHWLEAGLAALAGADLAAGLIRFDVEERPNLWALLDIDTFFDQERTVRAGRAVTANLFVRREVFARVAGFDPTLPNTGDFDFVHRAVSNGADLVYVPDAVVRHPTRDSPGSLLRKLWAVNRRFAARQGRSGERPDALKIRTWVPVVQTVRSRRRFGRSLRLDRRRLEENGIRPGLWDDLKAVPFLYLVFPYLSAVAQVRGWLEGRSA